MAAADHIGAAAHDRATVESVINVVFLLSPIIFIALQKITAPFGRHAVGVRRRSDASVRGRTALRARPRGDGLPHAPQGLRGARWTCRERSSVALRTEGLRSSAVSHMRCLPTDHGEQVFWLQDQRAARLVVRPGPSVTLEIFRTHLQTWPRDFANCVRIAHSLQELPAFSLPLLIRFRYGDLDVTSRLANKVLASMFALHYFNRCALPFPTALPTERRR